MREALTVYAIGVGVGLWRTDGPPATRVTLALLWPLGVFALVLTLGGLVVAAVIALGGRGR